MWRSFWTTLYDEVATKLAAEKGLRASARHEHAVGSEWTAADGRLLVREHHC